MIFTHQRPILAFYGQMRQKLKNIPRSNPAILKSEQKKKVKIGQLIKKNIAVWRTLLFQEFFWGGGVKRLVFFFGHKKLYISPSFMFITRKFKFLWHNEYFHGFSEDWDLFSHFMLLRKKLVSFIKIDLGDLECRHRDD